MRKTTRGETGEHDIRRRFIIDTVRIYEEKFPHEARHVKKSAKSMRNTRANVFGADTSGKDLRLSLRLPGRLYRALSLLEDPRIFHDEDELVWFMKTFPKYRVPERL